MEELEAEVVVVLSDESETIREEKDEPDEVLEEQEDSVSKSVVLDASWSSWSWRRSVSSELVVGSLAGGWWLLKKGGEFEQEEREDEEEVGDEVAEIEEEMWMEFLRESLLEIGVALLVIWFWRKSKNIFISFF